MPPKAEQETNMNSYPKNSPVKLEPEMDDCSDDRAIYSRLLRQVIEEAKIFQLPKDAR